MDLFGSYALLLAFAFALYAIFGGIAAIITRRPLLIKSARNAGFAVCVLIWIGTISLWYLFYTDNYSMAYVAAHSNRSLSPTTTNFSALWYGLFRKARCSSGVSCFRFMCFPLSLRTEGNIRS